MASQERIAAIKVTFEDGVWGYPSDTDTEWLADIQVYEAQIEGIVAETFAKLPWNIYQSVKNTPISFILGSEEQGGAWMGRSMRDAVFAPGRVEVEVPTDVATLEVDIDKKALMWTVAHELWHEFVQVKKFWWEDALGKEVWQGLLERINSDMFEQRNDEMFKQYIDRHRMEFIMTQPSKAEALAEAYDEGFADALARLVTGQKGKWDEMWDDYAQDWMEQVIYEKVGATKTAFTEGTKNDILAHLKNGCLAAWTKDGKWLFSDQPDSYGEIHDDISIALGYRGNKDGFGGPTTSTTTMVMDGWVRIRIDQKAIIHAAPFIIESTLPARAPKIADIVGLFIDLGIVDFDAEMEYLHRTSETDIDLDNTHTTPANILMKAASVKLGNTQARWYSSPSDAKELLPYLWRTGMGGTEGILFWHKDGRWLMWGRDDWDTDKHHSQYAAEMLGYDPGPDAVYGEHYTYEKSNQAAKADGWVRGRVSLIHKKVSADTANDSVINDILWDLYLAEMVRADTYIDAESFDTCSYVGDQLELKEHVASKAAQWTGRGWWVRGEEWIEVPRGEEHYDHEPRGEGWTRVRQEDNELYINREGITVAEAQDIFEYAWSAGYVSMDVVVSVEQGLHWVGFFSYDGDKLRKSASAGEYSEAYDRTLGFVQEAQKLTLERMPWRIHQAVKDVNVSPKITDVFTSEVDGTFYGSGWVGIDLRVGLHATVKDIMWTLAHEYWHAYTTLTDFWSSDESGKLADDIVKLDQMGGVQEAIQKAVEDRWDGMAWDLDERMADALAALVAGGDNDRFVKEFGDITHNMMENYIFERVAAQVLVEDEFEGEMMTRIVRVMGSEFPTLDAWTESANYDRQDIEYYSFLYEPQTKTYILDESDPMCDHAAFREWEQRGVIRGRIWMSRHYNYKLELVPWYGNADTIPAAVAKKVADDMEKKGYVSLDDRVNLDESGEGTVAEILMGKFAQTEVFERFFFFEKGRIKFTVSARNKQEGADWAAKQIASERVGFDETDQKLAEQMVARCFDAWDRVIERSPRVIAEYASDTTVSIEYRPYMLAGPVNVNGEAGYFNYNMELQVNKDATLNDLISVMAHELVHVCVQEWREEKRFAELLLPLVRTTRWYNSMSPEMRKLMEQRWGAEYLSTGNNMWTRDIEEQLADALANLVLGEPNNVEKALGDITHNYLENYLYERMAAFGDVLSVRGNFPASYEKAIKAHIEYVEDRLPERIAQVVKGVAVEFVFPEGQEDFAPFAYGGNFIGMTCPPTPAKATDMAAWLKKMTWALSHELWHVYVLRTMFYWQDDIGKEIVEWANWLYNTEFGKERLKEILEAIEKRWGYSGDAATRIFLEEAMADAFAELVTEEDTSPFANMWADIADVWMENVIFERVGAKPNPFLERGKPDYWLRITLPDAKPEFMGLDVVHTENLYGVSDFIERITWAYDKTMRLLPREIEQVVRNVGVRFVFIGSPYYENVKKNFGSWAETAGGWYDRRDGYVYIPVHQDCPYDNDPYEWKWMGSILDERETVATLAHEFWHAFSDKTKFWGGLLGESEMSAGVKEFIDHIILDWNDEAFRGAFESRRIDLDYADELMADALQHLVDGTTGYGAFYQTLQNFIFEKFGKTSAAKTVYYVDGTSFETYEQQQAELSGRGIDSGGKPKGQVEGCSWGFRTVHRDAINVDDFMLVHGKAGQVIPEDKPGLAFWSDKPEGGTMYSWGGWYHIPTGRYFNTIGEELSAEHWWVADQIGFDPWNADWARLRCYTRSKELIVYPYGTARDFLPKGFLERVTWDLYEAGKLTPDYEVSWESQNERNKSILAAEIMGLEHIAASEGLDRKDFESETED